MGKKRGSKSGKPHATRSFDQLVGKANQEALKPFINQQINSLAGQLEAHLRRLMLQNLSSVQLRIMVLEDIVEEKLGVSKDELAERIANEEDKAVGFIESSEGAIEGDTIRATINVKTESLEDFGSDQRMQIDNLAQAPFTVTEDFEKQLLGIKKGETREIAMDEGKTLVRVKVDRVSTLKDKPEVKAEEVASKEESNEDSDAQ